MRSQRSSIERELAELGGSIQVGARVRDETLQRVSESTGEVRRRNRSARTAVIGTAVMVLISPVLSALTKIEVPHPPTAAEVGSATINHVETHDTTYDWALVEVIRQFSLAKPW